MNIVHRRGRVYLIVIIAGALLFSLCLLVWNAAVVNADPGDEPGQDHHHGSGQMHMSLDQQDRLEASVYHPSTVAQGWTSLLFEDFEGDFPGTAWSLYGDPTWGDRGYRKYAGEFSGYAVGGGDHGVQPPGPYPNDVNSWMVAGPFDLTDATDAQVLFHSWLDTEYRSEDGHDDFMIYASVDGENWWGDYWYGDWTGADGCNGWCSDAFDLTDVYSLGNLCGQPEVWIALGFISDSTSSNNEGVYVDDINILAKLSGNPTQSEIFLPLVLK